MYKRTLFGMILALGILFVGTTAFAQGPGSFYVYGGGGMLGYGNNGAYNERTARIAKELHKKQLELQAVLSARRVNKARARALNAEINKLQNQLSNANLAANLKFRENKPNPSSRYGYGNGYGNGHHRR